MTNPDDSSYPQPVDPWAADDPGVNADAAPTRDPLPPDPHRWKDRTEVVPTTPQPVPPDRSGTTPLPTQPVSPYGGYGPPNPTTVAPPMPPASGSRTSNAKKVGLAAAAAVVAGGVVALATGGLGGQHPSDGDTKKHSDSRGLGDNDSDGNTITAQPTGRATVPTKKGHSAQPTATQATPSQQQPPGPTNSAEPVQTTPAPTAVKGAPAGTVIALVNPLAVPIGNANYVGAGFNEDGNVAAFRWTPYDASDPLQGQWVEFGGKVLKEYDRLTDQVRPGEAVSLIPRSKWGAKDSIWRIETDAGHSKLGIAFVSNDGRWSIVAQAFSLNGVRDAQYGELPLYGEKGHASAGKNPDKVSHLADSANLPAFPVVYTPPAQEITNYMPASLTESQSTLSL